MTIALTILLAVIPRLILASEQQHHAQPYDFGYSIDDGQGRQHRQESGDGGNHVRGSYGFTDSRGVYRHVDYVADDTGFHAHVDTNEPGTANQNPASVQVVSKAYNAGPVQPLISDSLGFGYGGARYSGSLYSGLFRGPASGHRGLTEGHGDTVSGHGGTVSGHGGTASGYGDAVLDPGGSVLGHGAPVLGHGNDMRHHVSGHEGLNGDRGSKSTIHRGSDHGGTVKGHSVLGVVHHGSGYGHFLESSNNKVKGHPWLADNLGFGYGGLRYGGLGFGGLFEKYDTENTGQYNGLGHHGKNDRVHRLSDVRDLDDGHSTKGKVRYVSGYQSLSDVHDTRTKGHHGSGYVTDFGTQVKAHRESGHRSINEVHYVSDITALVDSHGKKGNDRYASNYGNIVDVHDAQIKARHQESRYVTDHRTRLNVPRESGNHGSGYLTGLGTQVISHREPGHGDIYKDRIRNGKVHHASDIRDLDESHGTKGKDRYASSYGGIVDVHGTQVKTEHQGSRYVTDHRTRAKVPREPANHGTGYVTGLGTQVLAHREPGHRDINKVYIRNDKVHHASDIRDIVEGHGTKGTNRHASDYGVLVDNPGSRIKIRHHGSGYVTDLVTQVKAAREPEQRDINEVYSKKGKVHHAPVIRDLDIGHGAKDYASDYGGLVDIPGIRIKTEHRGGSSHVTDLGTQIIAPRAHGHGSVNKFYDAKSISHHNHKSDLSLLSQKNYVPSKKNIGFNSAASEYGKLGLGLGNYRERFGNFGSRFINYDSEFKDFGTGFENLDDRLNSYGHADNVFGTGYNKHDISHSPFFNVDNPPYDF